MKVFVGGLVAWAVLGACSGASFVDEITIVNNTVYSVSVDVAGKSRTAWLGVTVVQPETTTTVKQVIDQGEVWIFRFDYVGKYEEAVEMSRDELEQNDWTIEVPGSFEQRLRALDVPPPP